MQQIETRLISEISQILEDAPYGSLRADQRPRITNQRLTTWITETDMNVIGPALKLDGRYLNDVQQYVNAYRTLKEAGATSDLGYQIDVTAHAKHLLGDGKTLVKAKQAIVKELSSTLLGLPGDAMFINSLAPDATEGYVAYLRRIHEVSDRNVARTSQFVSADYLRVGRLLPPYIYALTQQVGSVFGSIGLPPEYEDHRDQTAELFKIFQLEDNG